MPVELLTALRQIKQGDVQATVAEHVPPQVAVAAAARSWRTERAPAESVPRNMAANNAFFTITVLLFAPLAALAASSKISQDPEAGS